MTPEELDAAVIALQATAASQAVEIQRHAEMIQTISESEDLNRRELQTATKKARDFTDEMEQQVTQATALHAELVAERAAPK